MADKIETDWQGKPVPDGETDDTTIYVWEVEPHPDMEHTVAVVRSWQELNDLMNRVPEMYLDGFTEEEAREGVTITIKLKSMTLGAYRELDGNE